MLKYSSSDFVIIHYFTDVYLYLSLHFVSLFMFILFFNLIPELRGRPFGPSLYCFMIDIFNAIKSKIHILSYST